jgi:hypothetical protein
MASSCWSARRPSRTPRRRNAQKVSAATRMVAESDHVDACVLAGPAPALSDSVCREHNASADSAIDTDGIVLRNVTAISATITLTGARWWRAAGDDGGRNVCRLCGAIRRIGDMLLIRPSGLSSMRRHTPHRRQASVQTTRASHQTSADGVNAVPYAANSTSTARARSHDSPRQVTPSSFVAAVSSTARPRPPQGDARRRQAVDVARLKVNHEHKDSQIEALANLAVEPPPAKSICKPRIAN